MKINIKEEIKTESFVSHLILHSMAVALADVLTKEARDNEGMLELKLTVNDYELPLKSFCEHWQNQVNDNIIKEAKRLIESKCGDISDLLYDLEGRLKDEVDKRLENWEKEND